MLETRVLHPLLFLSRVWLLCCRALSLDSLELAPELEVPVEEDVSVMPCQLRVCDYAVHPGLPHPCLAISYLLLRLSLCFFACRTRSQLMMKAVAMMRTRSCKRAR